MKSTKLFFSYFISRFYDSIKFNHSFAAKAKLYFERSTKYRQTIDVLGNVYRNSKWTDLKIQNIKSTHLTKFIRINFIIIFGFIALYLAVFRYSSVSIHSSTSELNYLWLLLTDFLNYVTSVTLILMLNIYTYLTFLYSKYTRLIGTSIGLRGNSSETLSAYSGLNTFNTTNLVQPTKLNRLFSNSSVINNNTSNANSLQSLFQLKTNLDYIETSTKSIHNNSCNPSPFSVFTSNTISDYNQTLSSRSISAIESRFSSIKYNNNISKLALTEQSTKELAIDPFLFTATEDSIKSSLSSANANRWLVKMLPFSESLPFNNLPITKLKENITDPTTESGTANRNIWLANSNLLNATSYMSTSKVTTIDNFEISRLWNQKRQYFTLLSKLSETKLSHVNAELKSGSLSVNNSFMLNLPSVDYSSLKSRLTLSLPCVKESNSKSALLNNNIFLSGLNLNYWNSLDQNYLLSICVSDNGNGIKYYYSYCSYTDLYNTI